MAKVLRVRLAMKIADLYARGLSLRGWVPGPETRLTLQVDHDLRVEIWLNPDDYSASAFEKLPEQWGEGGDIRVGTLTADVIVHGVSEDLCQFIVEHANDTAAEREAAPSEPRAAFENLGLRVQRAALAAVNRLLTFARVIKGQFWLDPVVCDDDDMAGFQTSTNARVSLQDGLWIRWNPSCWGTLKMTARDIGNRRFAKSDWPMAQAFLASKSAPPLHLELLSAAEALEGGDHTRVALTEAVAALEVALSRFFTSGAQVLESTLIADVDVKSYEALQTKLGLRGTLAILLPLVVGAEQLPRDVLRRTIKAVEVRGNVVHRGNRKLSKDEVAPLIFSIRRTIEALHALMSETNAA